MPLIHLTQLGASSHGLSTESARRAEGKTRSRRPRSGGGMPGCFSLSANLLISATPLSNANAAAGATAAIDGTPIESATRREHRDAGCRAPTSPARSGSSIIYIHIMICSRLRATITPTHSARPPQGCLGTRRGRAIRAGFLRASRLQECRHRDKGTDRETNKERDAETWTETEKEGERERERERHTHTHTHAQCEAWLHSVQVRCPMQVTACPICERLDVAPCNTM